MAYVCQAVPGSRIPRAHCRAHRETGRERDAIGVERWRHFSTLPRVNSNFAGKFGICTRCNIQSEISLRSRNDDGLVLLTFFPLLLPLAAFQC